MAASAPVQDLDEVKDYYCVPRTVGDAAMSIYEIWERGSAFHDSVTPSTYSPQYRAHIVGKLTALTAPGARIFSIGCGNGFVEGELVNLGREVIAVDCNEEAVLLTRKKGVEAFTADFFAVQPKAVATSAAIYADGLIGHLFHPTEGLTSFLNKMRALNVRRGTYLVLSNDSPRDASVEFAPHERVSGFWFIAKDYLAAKLKPFGWDPVESYYFPYSRPVSGVRNRTICVARAS